MFNVKKIAVKFYNIIKIDSKKNNNLKKNLFTTKNSKKKSFKQQKKDILFLLTLCYNLINVTNHSTLIIPIFIVTIITNLICYLYKYN